ncbi:DegT/DnrJ/EryC1/StrS family aminotransferase [Clostridium ganghwense]|uniref:DegT/DnrJ/EryC1/StrS family aminotransferase n=1 Tax=Clostridium ganghwense TaxID=312089 RepID=A0ABT4CRC5_9CLOT|nr:DegT/DnrJ/EryC1/StrS family aminotransferase [Clostridium ganghwense]MCY6370544.1 DegT/DnrJ/EryC1/StrS family aminotransferase [Clostridium ganghwense]
MINVTKTYIPDSKKYKSYIDKIFSSGWLTNNGQFVRQLEKRLKQYLNVKNILLVCNGTIALQLAYRLLELKGKIITTPFTFVATVSSQVWEGLNPIFCDIDKETYNIDSQKIEKSITDNSSAIVPVHVFGNSCDINFIDSISKKNNLKVVYDASHAFGVTYKGKSILEYGDISTLSFHATKLFHTVEGGALVIKDDKLYEKAKKMINFGIYESDNIKYLGINAKMNELQAAMGLCVLDDIDKIIYCRKMVHEYYMSKLPQNLQFQKQNKYSSRNYSYFPVVFEDEKILLRVEYSLKKEGVNPRRYFYPSLEKLNYLNKNQYAPISSSISKRILCLPMYDSLTVKDQDKIINVIKKSV